jgi:hypothetical protein
VGDPGGIFYNKAKEAIVTENRMILNKKNKKKALKHPES